MAVQGSANIANVAFIRHGSGLILDNETFLTDGSRTTDMVKGTVVARIASSGKWVPFTDETATDGSQIPKGILMRTLAAADIAAADVTGVPVLVKGEIIDREQVTVENSKTLDTVVNVPTSINSTVEELLRWTCIYVESTVDVDAYEN